jgi:hypothetical protein
MRKTAWCWTAGTQQMISIGVEVRRNDKTWLTDSGKLPGLQTL